MDNWLYRFGVLIQDHISCNSHTSVVWTLCSVPLLSILRRSGCDTDTIIMWTFGSVPLLSLLRKIDCILSFLNWQPNARRGNDYSYARMDGPHINGGIPHGDTVPTHLTNGYAENMMTNVSVFYTWYSLFLFCACTVCTWKSANNRCNTYKPWITSGLKKSMKVRETCKFYKKWLITHLQSTMTGCTLIQLEGG